MIGIAPMSTKTIIEGWAGKDGGDVLLTPAMIEAGAKALDDWLFMVNPLGGVTPAKTVMQMAVENIVSAMLEAR